MAKQQYLVDISILQMVAAFGLVTVKSVLARRAESACAKVRGSLARLPRALQ